MALTLILGISAELPATLPFACGSDGGRSTRVGICSRVGRGWKLGVASRSVSNGDRIYRLRAALCLGEERFPALALALIPGHFAARTAPLPFAHGSDGGRNNRAIIRNRVVRGWELGAASRSSSTGDRSYRPASSLLAYV